MKAVVFVDVQKDFIDGTLENEKAIEVTPRIVEFAKECVDKGYKIYATRDTHEKTEYAKSNIQPLTCAESMTIESGYLSTLEGKNLPIEHCIEGTDGWMIDERLWNIIEGKSTVVNKPTFGSYDLAEIINEDFFDTYQYIEQYHCKIKCNRKEEDALDEIIICGFCTSICVLSNAILLRAKFPNIKITVMKDLCACVTEESHNAALKCLEMQQVEIV